jgi:hypothetical protein
LLGAAARTAVVAGTATATVGAVRGHQSRREQEAAEQAAAQQAAQQQAAQQQAMAQQQAAVPPPQGLTDKLKELADLKAAGALSDEEFAAAKAQLLGT